MAFSPAGRLAPGFSLYLGRHAASLSVGVRGLHATIGKRTRTTIGLPGSGPSYTVTHGPLAVAGQWLDLTSIVRVALWGLALWMLLRFL